MRRVAVLALGATFAEAIRVALYFGSGISEPSAGNYSVALTQMLEAGEISSYSALNATELDSELTNEAYDVVLFPGGMSTTESGAIGPTGLAAVKAFVAAGGGYVGTCAGAYLAITAECCDTAVSGYCNGTTGCFKDPWALGLVNVASANPWARGHGLVNLTFSDAAVEMLQLPAGALARPTAVYSSDGP
jgi:hypothetical protein